MIVKTPPHSHPACSDCAFCSWATNDTGAWMEVCVRRERPGAVEASVVGRSCASERNAWSFLGCGKKGRYFRHKASPL